MRPPLHQGGRWTIIPGELAAVRGRLEAFAGDVFGSLPRFLGVQPDPFAFVPHGGGDPGTGHRCPGERVTVELLKGAVRVLAGLAYQVPDQDLGYRLGRMPTRPRSGVRIANVRPA